MPALFLLLLILLAYAWQTGQFGRGVAFLFTPDFSAITPAGVLTAMGHAFFSLSLAVGTIMVYGSYLPAGISIGRTSILIAFLDTLVALMAALVIFPIVFVNGLPVGEGPGLVFQTLPIAFGQMPGGIVFGTLFFVLLAFAAWTSSVSLLEPAVAWMVENRGVSRGNAAVWVGSLVWLLGILTVMSFSDWAFEFEFAGKSKANGLFDVMDILTSSILLPLGGLAVVLFAGRVLSREVVAGQLGGRGGFGFRLWYLVIRYITPLGMLLVFFRAIGVI